jgi:spore maturation protein CgeB
MQDHNLSSAVVHASVEKSLRILYVAMKYDYGKQEQGYSFEHCNFYESIREMGHSIIYFDFMTLMQQHSREWMNIRLIEVVKAEKPDLMFTVLFADELDPQTIKYISESTDTITLNWFCDDHWRFDNYSSYWAPCFNWVVTTAQSALPKYAKLGYQNVIKSQWGCNNFQYKKLDIIPKYDVTFVGQPYGDRRQIIDMIRKAGIDVQTWGKDWDNGRLPQEEMIQVFNASRINLNLTNSFSTHSQENLECPPSRFARLKNLLNRQYIWQEKKSNTQQFSQQIKGRNFEVPGCSGFLITTPADNLEDYYVPDQEIVLSKDTSDLIEKIKFYLENEGQRRLIACAGYERTLKEHTYVKRFNDIFQEIGLLATSSNSGQSHE